MLRKPPVAYAMLVLFLLSAAFFAVESANAQGSAPTATVLVAKLNVRAGPGTTYAVLGQVSAKDVLNVAGQAQNCGWLKVQTEQLNGWVSGSRQYVKLSTACKNIPPAAADVKPAATVVASNPVTTTGQPAAAPPAAPVAAPPATAPATPTVAPTAVPTQTPAAEESEEDPLPPDMGCFLMANLVGPELNVTITGKDSGKSESFKVPAGGETVWCLYPGKYAVTIDAPPPWDSLNTDISIQAGERFRWPIAGRE